MENSSNNKNNDHNYAGIFDSPPALDDTAMYDTTRDIQPPAPSSADLLLSSIESANVPTRLNNLQMKAPTLRIANQKRCSLPMGYVPGDKDVVSGRGKRNWNHLGNINFRNVIRSNVQRYIDSPSKNDKTLVVISIVDEIRASGGRFLKEDMHGRWYDIGDAQARDKVGHSLRDQVSALSRQKNKKQAKKEKLLGAVEEQQSLQMQMQYEPAEPQRRPRRHQLEEGEEQGVGRRPSIQSDSGNEVDMRRSSHFTSFLINTFTRRPSFLAFSFGSKQSSDLRASNLMGGEQNAGQRLENVKDSVRRSSNWEFLDGLEDFMDDFQENGGQFLDNDHGGGQGRQGGGGEPVYRGSFDAAAPLDLSDEMYGQRVEI